MTTNSNEQMQNDFFKSMAEVSEESKKWEEYTRNVVAFWIQKASAYLQSTSEKRVTVRQYGSSAEGLKCYLPHDIGDVDLMIFPAAKEMEITEDMLEEIDGKPGFVRICGANHPVLKRCLFKGSDFVATATLKKLHPEIFGEVSAFSQLAARLRVAISGTENPVLANSTHKFTNSADGPAVTMDFAQSFDSLIKQDESLRDESCYQNSPAALETYAAFLCEGRGVPYTREHAVLFNSFLENCKEQIQSVAMEGRSLLPEYPRLMNEFVCGARMQELVHLREQLEGRLAVSQNECAESGSAENEIAETGSAENGSDKARSTETGSAYGQESSSVFSEIEKESANYSLSSSEEREIRGADRGSEICDAGNETRKSPSDSSQPESELEAVEQGHSEESAAQGRNSDNSAKLLSAEALLGSPYLARLFNVSDADVKDESSCYDAEAATHDRLGGADFVPAFQGQGWPEVAKEWCSRPRQWPSRDIIEKITRESFHVVVKTPKTGGNPDLDFRLSFSHAEYLLSQEMSDIQKECYRCLKLFHRAFLRTDEEVLTTYHLKTVLLWTVEETGLEIWSEENRAFRVLMLLDRLQIALSSKVLPHYFIDSCNLFEHAASEYPELLELLANKVEDIRRRPTEMVLERSEPTAAIADGGLGEMSINSGASAAAAQSVPSDIQEGSMAVATARPVSSEIASRAVSTAQSAALGLSADFASASVPPLPLEHHLSYHDFQDLYVDTAGEIANLALSGADVPTDDPVLSELEADMRAMREKHPELTVEDFVRMFKSTTTMAYAKFQKASSTDIIQRILRELKEWMKMFRFCSDTDLLSPGNEEAIVQRLLDPSGGFDLSQVFPAGCGVDLVRGILNFVEPAATATDLVPDDIPLD